MPQILNNGVGRSASRGKLSALWPAMDIQKQEKTQSFLRQTLAWLIEQPDSKSVFETVRAEREQLLKLEMPERIREVFQLLK